MHVVAREAYGPVTAYNLGFGPLGPPWMTVRCYRLGDLLIDTGQAHLRRRVLSLLAPRPPGAVVLTHHHEDHSGNAAAIQKKFGAPVYGHALTAAKMGSAFSIRPYQHYLWGRAKPLDVLPLPADLEAAGRRLTPIHAPGHSKDHTVYLVPDEGWLFSGDLFLGERIKYFRSDENFADQIASLRQVLALDFEALFCAHRPVLQHGRAALGRKLAFLEELYGRISDLHRQGHGARGIVRALDPGCDHMARIVTLGNVSFGCMVRSALKSMEDGAT